MTKAEAQEWKVILTLLRNMQALGIAPRSAILLIAASYEK